MLSLGSLGGRLLLLGLLLGAELLVASVTFDGETVARTGFAAAVGAWAPWCARFGLAFAGLFTTFIVLRFPAVLGQAVESPPQAGGLAVHAVAMLAFWQCSALLFGGRADAWLAPAWLASGLVTVGAAALALVPRAAWQALARQTGWLWAYAAAAASTALVLAGTFRSLWKPTSWLTFRLVEAMLRPWVGEGIVYQPERLRLGTSRFTVIIAEECSGLEGIGLLLVFGLVCLLVFHRELRFPHCLVLFPAGVTVLFLLNAVRITALALVGHWGAREVALGGFHSQAGWIAFNLVAFGLCWLAQRWPWLWHASMREEPVKPDAGKQDALPDATSAYLLPFLAILGAGMIAGAMSAGFEWAYPLRVAAAGALLWHYRHLYTNLNWRPGWPAVWGAGLVFLLWMAGEWWWSTPVAGMPAALAQSAPLPATLWIVLRALGAVVTVPLAEELAFRGFLLRRWQQEAFTAVPLTRWTVGSLAASSVLFGLLHGSRWPAGVAAGLIYGWVMTRRGSLGDAVAAHALTNALIVAAVVLGGNWQLW